MTIVSPDVLAFKVHSWQNTIGQNRGAQRCPLAEQGVEQLIHTILDEIERANDVANEDSASIVASQVCIREK